MKALLTTVVIGCVGAGAMSIADTPGRIDQEIQYERTLLVQLGVADLDRSIEFYRDTLGFELESRNDELHWARIDPGIDGVTIGLGEKPDVHASDAISMNIGVTDLGIAREVLEARGVAFDGPTVKVPGVVQLADLRDPDGHRIRLAGHGPGYGDPEVEPDDGATGLEALAWLEGEWHGSHGARSWQEHWSAPKAGSIVGMFRMIDGGKPMVYELLLIEEQGDSIVYHLRHFGDKLRTWEEGPILFDVVRADQDTIVFKNRSNEDGPSWIRYSRDGENAMEVWVGATKEPSDRGFSLNVKRAGAGH